MLGSLRTLALAQDRQVLSVLLLGAFCLTLLNYFSVPRQALQTLGELGLPSLQAALADWLAAGEDPLLRRRLYGVLMASTIYCLPLLYMLMSGRSWRDWGLSLRLEQAFWRILLLVLLFMLPLVWLMSATPAFQNLYPFYRPPLQNGWLQSWLLFEAGYLLQFFALELFFRGFLLHGLRPALGVQAVAVMMVPYCMLHFGKPMPEALASIIAGVVLGLISYRSRSFALGFVLHATVALSMDSAVLWRQGYFAGVLT